MKEKKKKDFSIQYYFENIAPLILDNYYKINPSELKITAKELEKKLLPIIEDYLKNNGVSLVEKLNQESLITSIEKDELLKTEIIHLWV